MRCNRCGNENPALFYNDQGLVYCRKCIGFGRINIGEYPAASRLSKRVWKGKPSLEYELTAPQKKASAAALESLKNGRDVFVYAATGAGKTEMTFESICFYLSQGKKVGFAISRRQVVIEIAARLRKAFPELSVIEVCQGYTDVLDADLIVCTTHQLYRYHQGFDLLILDELDAFPYAGNAVLQRLAKDACKGQKMLLSATPDAQSLEAIERKEMDLVQLFERPHKHKLAEPKVMVLNESLQLVLAVYYCLKFKKEKKRVLLFVPRIADGPFVKRILSFFTSAYLISSKTENKDEVMDRFRNMEFQVLISTTLLERGITVPSVQVVVLFGEHSVFTSASLIQIFGRVGRSFSDPEGMGVCLCSYKSKNIQECCAQISMMNRTAFPA
jgi:competence protein ComFA